jgi:hypothetical protein
MHVTKEEEKKSTTKIVIKMIKRLLFESNVTMYLTDESMGFLATMEKV